MLYLIAHYVHCDKFFLQQINFLIAITSRHESVTYSDATTNEQWRDVMQQETNALEDNETWEIVDLPPNKKGLGCKWILKIKCRSMWKGSSFSLDNHHIAGIEFTNTFAPNAKKVMIRIFLAIGIKVA